MPTDHGTSFVEVKHYFQNYGWNEDFLSQYLPNFLVNHILEEYPKMVQTKKGQAKVVAY